MKRYKEGSRINSKKKNLQNPVRSQSSRDWQFSIVKKADRVNPPAAGRRRTSVFSSVILLCIIEGAFEDRGEKSAVLVCEINCVKVQFIEELSIWYINQSLNLDHWFVGVVPCIFRVLVMTRLNMGEIGWKNTVVDADA